MKTLIIGQRARRKSKGDDMTGAGIVPVIGIPFAETGSSSVCIGTTVTSSIPLSFHSCINGHASCPTVTAGALGAASPPSG